MPCTYVCTVHESVCRERAGKEGARQISLCAINFPSSEHKEICAKLSSNRWGVLVGLHLHWHECCTVGQNGLFSHTVNATNALSSILYQIVQMVKYVGTYGPKCPSKTTKQSPTRRRSHTRTHPKIHWNRFVFHDFCAFNCWSGGGGGDDDGGDVKVQGGIAPLWPSYDGDGWCFFYPYSLTLDKIHVRIISAAQNSQEKNINMQLQNHRENSKQLSVHGETGIVRRKK